MEEAKIKKMREEKKKAKVRTTLKRCMIFSRSTSLTSPFITLFKKNLLWVQLEEESKDLVEKVQAADPSEQQVTPPAPEPVPEVKKPGRRRSAKAEPAPVVQQTDEERLAQGKRVPGARSKAKALAKAQAEAEAAAQAAMAAKRAAERRAQAQKRLEERKRQQLITEELKKPTEDMCLTDHKVSPVAD